MNTFFRKKEGRKWTWRNPNSNIKNETDLVLIDRVDTIQDVMEPVSKFSGSLFDSENNIKCQRYTRTAIQEHHKPFKLKTFLAGGGNKQHTFVPVCSPSQASSYPEESEKECDQKCTNSTKSPLKLTVTVCSQKGSLGISIAGGKGSSPYKANDEGIFISRVSKGGPAELAGIQVGDRVLEVRN
nr:PREDICTED: protein lap4-like [Latimeria chalumnae]|eukprot:XP_014350638.1 PREDICTED: protein lap4-like [Latimeria chalumnae]